MRFKIGALYTSVARLCEEKSHDTFGVAKLLNMFFRSSHSLQWLNTLNLGAESWGQAGKIDFPRKSDESSQEWLVKGSITLKKAHLTTV